MTNAYIHILRQHGIITHDHDANNRHFVPQLLMHMITGGTLTMYHDMAHDLKIHGQPCWNQIHRGIQDCVYTLRHVVDVNSTVIDIERFGNPHTLKSQLHASSPILLDHASHISQLLSHGCTMQYSSLGGPGFVLLDRVRDFATMQSWFAQNMLSSDDFEVYLPLTDSDHFMRVQSNSNSPIFWGNFSHESFQRKIAFCQNQITMFHFLRHVEFHMPSNSEVSVHD